MTWLKILPIIIVLGGSVFVADKYLLDNNTEPETGEIQGEQIVEEAAQEDSTATTTPEQNEINRLRAELEELKNQKENQVILNATISSPPDNLSDNQQAIKEIEEKITQIKSNLAYTEDKLLDSIEGYLNCDDGESVFDVQTCRDIADRNAKLFDNQKEDLLLKLDEYERLRLQLLSQ